MIFRVLVFLFISGTLGAQSSLELSKLYFTQAQSQWSLGNKADALSLVNSALEFQDNNSDALTLRAEIYLSLEKISQARKDVENALSFGKFYYIKPTQGQKILFKILLQTRDYKTLEALVKPSQIILNYDLSVGYFQSLDRQGKTKEAADLLDQIDKYHGLNPLVLEHLLRYPSQFPSLGNRLKKHKKDQGGFSTEELERISWRLPENKEDKKWVISQLTTLGYLSPELNLQAYLNNQIGVAQFLENQGKLPFPKDYQGLVEAFIKDKTSEEEGKFQQFINNFSGDLVWDQDRDGWAEVYLQFKNGQVTSWSGDSDQNGFRELELNFSSGTLISLGEKSEQESFQVEFEEYPYLNSLDIHKADSREHFLFSPYRTSWNLLTLTTAPIPDFLHPAYWKWNKDPLVLPKLLQEVAQLEYYNHKNLMVKRSKMVGGQEVTREEDTNGDGRRDQVIIFMGGGISKAWKDMDGDGVPEILQKVDAQGMTLWADSNGDRVTDFLLNSNQWKIWDFNQDGEPDFRLLELPKGETLKIVSYRGRSDALQLMPPWETIPWP